MSSAPRIIFIKSHISGYTRADGTYVQPHEDRRLPASDRRALMREFQDQNVAVRAPKGGATSHLNGERYEGGQFMATQYDMPKSYKKKIKETVQKTEGTNIASLTVRPGMGGMFHVDKVMAGSTKKESVFSGTEQQANIFAKELHEQKRASYERKGLMPHPTELNLSGG